MHKPNAPGCWTEINLEVCPLMYFSKIAVLVLTKTHLKPQHPLTI